MLDLAPHNPYSLLVRHPVVARAGLRGAGVERLAHTDGVGAILSDPLLPRDQPTDGGWEETTAGVVWPDGGRGIERAQRDVARWSSIRRPVIVSLRASSPSQLRETLVELDPEAHPAICLDLTSVAAADSAREYVAAVRRDWLKPVLVEVSLDSPSLLVLVAALNEADALVIGRGGVALGGDVAKPVRGRVVGPAIHSMVLAALHDLRDHTDKPLIMGAARLDHASALLQRGATAILLDVGLWHTPELATQIVAQAGHSQA